MHVTSVLSTWAGCTLQEEGGDTAGYCHKKGNIFGAVHPMVPCPALDLLPAFSVPSHADC
jgi:hypothetical protein